LAVVLELLLAHGVLRLFRGREGPRLAFRPRVAAPAVPLARLRRGLRALGTALRVARALRAAPRVRLRALGPLVAAHLGLGLRGMVALSRLEARDDLLLDVPPDQPLDVAQQPAVFARH